MRLQDPLEGIPVSPIASLLEAVEDVSEKVVSEYADKYMPFHARFDRVDLALIMEDTFATPVNGMADIRAISIEGDGNIGAIDASNANFVGSSEVIGVDAPSTMVKMALSIGDITPGGTAIPYLRISADSLAAGDMVIEEIRIHGGDLAEAIDTLQIDTNGVVYMFPIVAVDGTKSIDGEIIPAATGTFVTNPDDHFVTDGQTTCGADTAQ